MTEPLPCLPLPDPARLAVLRADLVAADYTVDAVHRLLGPVAARALEREQVVPARLALAALEAAHGAARDGGEDAGGDVGGERDCAVLARATLVRLFQLGELVSAQAVAAALPGTGASGLAELGLIAREGEHVRALVELSPYSAEDAQGGVDWWIASDLSEVARGGTELPPDYVLGIGGASRTLAQITVREPVERALDVGAGCGIQALHLARHAREVVATDVDERALAFARFNATLNLRPEDGRIDLRLGSLLEPVAGERFDLVVSNPPFVITPRAAGVAEFTYRDGGARGDDLVRSLITSLGGVLAPGGVAQLLGNWEIPAGRDWRERVTQWLAGPECAGLDAWVVQREVQDPAEYAELWLRDGGQTPDRDRAGYDAAYAAWLTDLASRDARGVGFGFVTLRSPALPTPAPGDVWRRVEEISGPVQQPLGQTVSETLAAVAQWRGASAGHLLGQRWRVAPDVIEERFHTPGEAAPTVIRLRAGGGFRRTLACDTALAAFVGACDGELSGSQIIPALAALLEVDAAALAAELLPQVADLAVDGLLLPEVPEVPELPEAPAQRDPSQD